MNSPSELIRAEITRQGPISFARFMELALYAPATGYYERQKEIGRRGDFYTSVSVGPLFGELLAFQFSDWLNHTVKSATPIGSSSKANLLPPVQIVEAGAHDGRLARDILTALRLQTGDLWDQLEYWILEPSARHQEWQRHTLEAFAGKVRWFSGWDALPPGGVRGVLFSNELLDAMPVVSVVWDSIKAGWHERMVDWKGNGFVWRLQPLAAELTDRLPLWIRDLSGQLPDGFTTEFSPGALEWHRRAADALRNGELVVIDYGLGAEKVLKPHGTLRAYFRQQASADVLASPGEQDITAHVDFSELQRVGETAGLTSAALVPQSTFLTQVFEKAWKSPGAFGEWTPQRTRQFQTLTHPEHLGRAFSVLVQARRND
jgi:SAM-dependent MidA family methyltransferase